MKKNILLVAALIIAHDVFAQEYTIYLSGKPSGVITVQKERSGKITITPNLSKEGSVWIGNTICPLLPEDGFYIGNYRGVLKSIVIDGDTTTVTMADGKWEKTVITGNTKTESSSDGSRTKTVIDGNTLTKTHSSGNWEKQVLNGNTITLTSSYGHWKRLVVTRNTLTITSSGTDELTKVVINGNTTTATGLWGGWYEETIRGDTRTFKYDYGGYREVVSGNTITKTSLDGKNKLVVDKQGNDIFITETGYAPYYGYIGISEKDRIQSILDTVTSGRIKDGLFDKITYTGGR
ncbi:MAG: hypothetical protein Pg6A_02790 [Termitinemataceae bacterium]|nr:MAG: hypothetical protein Pg6A_02790 [Termitinemataceae bacterium]